MSFFRNIGNALARFMYGRNGMDRLNVVMIWGCIALELISSLLARRAPTPALVLQYVSLAAWVLALFRMFSKNLYKRREENSKFLTFWWKIKNGGSSAKARRADTEHKYYTCKKCKTVCRVPVGKGKIVITCPKCGAQIHAKS